jgi:hypothetical protein
MADKLISQLEEGIPASTDHVIYDPSGSGYYKKAQVGNLPGGGGSGLTQLSTPTLTAAVISSSQINLSWTNVANESSYKLEWSPNGSSGWTQIGGTIAANTTTYSHTGLTAATQYYYRVSAIGDGVTYSDSGYGTDNDTTSAGSSGLPHTSNFTAANGTLLTAYTPDAGNEWTAELGTLEIQSNKASVLTDDGGGNSTILTDFEATEYTATVIATRVAGADRIIYIKFRYVDANNQMIIIITNNTIALYKYISGVLTAEGSTVVPSPTIADTSVHTFVLTVGATTCDLTCDGISSFTGRAIDASLSAGTLFGIGGSSSPFSAGDVTFDSVSAV